MTRRRRLRRSVEDRLDRHLGALLDLLARHPLLVAVILLVLILATGTAGYVWVEGWGLSDALWMVLITLTTIGFGEVRPLDDSGRVLTTLLIVAGVSVGTYTMTQLTALVVEGAVTGALSHRRRRHRVQGLKEHYIIVGYGRLGQAIVEELHASDVPLCIVEREGPRARALEEAGEHPVVIGDGSNDDVLRRAGIERATGLAVAVSSSAEAVFITLSARQLSASLNIVTRVQDPEHAIKARRAGANNVVSPHLLGGWRMAHGLIRPATTSFLDIATLAQHQDAAVEEHLIPKDSRLVGRSLGQLRFADRFGVLVVAIRRADGRILATPRASTLLDAGDTVIVFGTPEAVKKFREKPDTPEG